jgi:hypothetical protein
MKTEPNPLPKIMQDVEQYAMFRADGRDECVIEITNEDHSATFAYAVPEYGAQIVLRCNSHEQLVEALRESHERLLQEDSTYQHSSQDKQNRALLQSLNHSQP